MLQVLPKPGINLCAIHILFNNHLYRFLVLLFRGFALSHTIMYMARLKLVCNDHQFCEEHSWNCKISMDLFEIMTIFWCSWDHSCRVCELFKNLYTALCYYQQCAAQSQDASVKYRQSIPPQRPPSVTALCQECPGSNPGRRSSGCDHFSPDKALP